VARRNEIHVFLRGGFGNQLFQYAIARALSIRYSKQLVVREDLLPERKDTVAGVTRWPNEIVGFHHSGTIYYRKHQPPMGTNLFSKVMQLMRIFGDFYPNLALALGILASDKTGKLPRVDLAKVKIINSYCIDKEKIADSKILIYQELQKLANPSNTYFDLRNALTDFPKTIVHIRKGDYLGLSEIYGVIDADYFSRAINLLAEKGKLHPIWIFTDTPERLTEEEVRVLNPERVVGPADVSSPLENLLLMTKAQSLIASNSSFSWWASQLCEMRTPVVAPIITNARFNNFDSVDDSSRNIEILSV